MQYIVLDIEWNQPLGPSLQVKEPVVLKGDIIELGAVRLDADFHIMDTYRAYVKPEYYRKMHRKVGNLTHIDPQLLNSSPAFREIYSEFIDWCGEDFRFITWSPNDLPMLINNMEIRSIPTDTLPDAIDVQEIFDEQITRDGRNYGLSAAMKLMNLPIETAHDALNDAINTVRICECLDMEEGVRWFDDACCEDEIYA